MTNVCIRIGNLTLFRWKDGSRVLRVRVEDPFAPAPVLAGWTPFFVGRHSGHVNHSYRRAA